MERTRRIVRGALVYGWKAPAIASSRGVSAVRGWLSRTRFSLLTIGRVGRSVTIEESVFVTTGARVVLGESVHVGAGCMLVVNPKPEASLTVGDRTWISRGCVLAAHAPMKIGRDVLIGEYVSIYDTTHRSEILGVPINRQGDVIGSVEIEDGAWIGRGCMIQGKPGGIVVGAGAIVGANSVVTRSIPPNTIWAGAPLRLLRNRSGQTDGRLGGTR